MQNPVVGIEIGGTKLQVVLGDIDGSIRSSHRFAVDHAEGAVGIRRQLETTLRALQAERPGAVAVGYGGPVDWRTGRICCSHHVKGWSEFPLGDWLRELTGLPVNVDNDANVAALGEAMVGAGKGRNPVLYVTLGSGVGGGVVLDGRIYHGIAPGEVEIGHVRLDRVGATVESRCAGWAVDRRVREAALADPAGLLARLVRGVEGGEARHLGPALAAADPVAQTILGDTATDLAFGLSHAVHLFHPEIIILGGGLSLLGELLRGVVAKALPEFVMEAFRPGPEVIVSPLRENAVPVGALLLAGQAAQAG
ncbi:MAG: ROK family protein [Limisphaerales bacterium]